MVRRLPSLHRHLSTDLKVRTLKSDQSKWILQGSILTSPTSAIATFKDLQWVLLMLDQVADLSKRALPNLTVFTNSTRKCTSRLQRWWISRSKPYSTAKRKASASMPSFASRASSTRWIATAVTKTWLLAAILWWWTILEVLSHQRTRTMSNRALKRRLQLPLLHRRWRNLRRGTCLSRLCRQAILKWLLRMEPSHSGLLRQELPSKVLKRREVTQWCSIVSPGTMFHLLTKMRLWLYKETRSHWPTTRSSQVVVASAWQSETWASIE